MRPLCRVLRAALCFAQAQQRRQNRFCKIEPSLAADSSEASEDGGEASDGRSDVGLLREISDVPERCRAAERLAYIAAGCPVAQSVQSAWNTSPLAAPWRAIGAND